MLSLLPPDLLTEAHLELVVCVFKAPVLGEIWIEKMTLFNLIFFHQENSKTCTVKAIRTRATQATSWWATWTIPTWTMAPYRRPCPERSVPTLSFYFYYLIWYHGAKCCWCNSEFEPENVRITSKTLFVCGRQNKNELNISFCEAIWESESARRYWIKTNFVWQGYAENKWPMVLFTGEKNYSGINVILSVYLRHDVLFSLVGWGYRLFFLRC